MVGLFVKVGIPDKISPSTCDASLHLPYLFEQTPENRLVDTLIFLVTIIYVLYSPFSPRYDEIPLSTETPAPVIARTRLFPSRWLLSFSAALFNSTTVGPKCLFSGSDGMEMRMVIEDGQMKLSWLVRRKYFSK